MDEAPSTIEAADYPASPHSLRSNHSAPPLPVLLSLFSGAGGLDMGFHQAGFTTALAIDFNKDAIKSFNENFDPPVGVVDDLNELKGCGVVALMQEKVKKGSSVGIIGGPPCQGFSIANTNALLDDPRNKLPFIYLDIVESMGKIYDVPFVVLENVSGIRNPKHASTYKKLLSRIEELGFALNEFFLDASLYGVPQKRKRVVLIGVNKKIKNSSIELLPLNIVLTVKDAIGELGEPKFYSRDANPDEFPHHPNHWTMRPKSAKFTNNSKNTGRSFQRIEWDKPSKTIAFGNREILVHPNGHRRLSIYEAMLLQGFPKTFRLHGSLSSQVTQVSNAVPPPLAKVIAENLKNKLNQA